MSNILMVVVIERDGDLLVAQCDPYDICTQGRDLNELFYRLSLQIAVEIDLANGIENVQRLPPELQGEYSGNSV